MVEAIFVEEEGARGRLMTFDVLRDVDDVAAGAKAAAFGVVDEDDADVGIVAPLDQRMGHVTDHLAIEAVKRLRTVEPQPSREPVFPGQHVVAAHRHIHHGIIA